MQRNKYDTFWGRFSAGIIDSLVFLPFAFLDAYFLDPNRNIILALVWMMISYSSFSIYSIYFHWRSGQTIGKRAMGVKVVDVNETRGLTLKQSFLRDSIYVVLQAIGIAMITINTLSAGYYMEYKPGTGFYILAYLSFLWFVIEIISMLTNKKKRAIHDYIANTVVVNT